MARTMNDLDTLTNILADLEKLPPDRRPLLTEHLEGARFYLMGAMPKELPFNLQLAAEALDSLNDAALKARIREFIEAHR
jgi:hypothetical protein